MTVLLKISRISFLTALYQILKKQKIILRKIFIEQFISAKRVVDKLKECFGEKITVYLVEKDFKNQVIQFKENVDKIDSYIILKYTEKQLKELIKEYEII